MSCSNLNKDCLGYEEVEWRDVVGYEEQYQVSSHGDVRRKKSGRPRKLTTTYAGYLCVILCKNSKTQQIQTHRLVAQAFIPNPDNLPIVNHKDESRDNNHYSNLEWCTYSYNSRYGSLKDRRKQYSGQAVPVRQYSLEGYFIQDFVSTTEASRISGAMQSNIVYCCKGDRPTAGGYRWSYLDTSNCKPRPKIIQVEQLDKHDNVIGIFESARDAARKLNCAQTHISKCCKGVKKTYKGCFWRYKRHENTKKD